MISLGDVVVMDTCVTSCVVVSCRVVPEHSFMDYVKGGCEIGLLVAVDFTVRRLTGL